MIKGLDQLQRDLKQAQIALKELDGTLCTINFDPFDPASIEHAIQEVSNTIDQRVGVYAGNPFVGPLIEGMKENYRSRIIEQAAEKRLTGESK
ncbi:hypothetical protein H8F21_02305 [Pseudomonas sp. P66]|uniref:Uncharacterized protein n=1 Tax=Pseudomonas arcuscaelestis TaxID=2710591 RepID=A0ABS2BS01_9PSED|nr:hypothetical protein [Pseudomonas arcuscaelestis]MBM5456397.1 hypothetical protein [Pseudomonas arcuscaelestis]